MKHRTRILHGKGAEYILDIIQMYRYVGLSTHKISRELGLTKSCVANVVQWVGISRSKQAAAVLASPAKSTHWRAVRQAARVKWMREVSPIPKGYHIHHKDGDCKNNTLSNLEMMSAGDHMKKHWDESGRRNPYAGRRWKDPKRKAYMKAYREKRASCGV